MNHVIGKVSDSGVSTDSAAVSEVYNPAKPSSIETACTLQDIVALVNKAEQAGQKLRAVGSNIASAWEKSDVGVTEGIRVDTRATLSGFLDDDLTLLKPDLVEKFSNEWNDNLSVAHGGFKQEVGLVSVKAGTVVAAFVNELTRRGQAPLQLGGSMIQTLAGAISTSTHGSGMRIGCYSDLCEQVVIVSTAGKVWQIEASDGVTCREKFAREYPNGERELVQDDVWLNAVRVSLGCFGVIYSVMIKVANKPYYLNENITVMRWSEVRELFCEESVFEKNRDVQLFMSPYFTGDRRCGCCISHRSVRTEEQQGDRLCALIERQVLLSKPEARTLNERTRPMHYLDPFKLPLSPTSWRDDEAVGEHPDRADPTKAGGKLSKLVSCFFRCAPAVVPLAIDRTIAGLADKTYKADSWRVLTWLSGLELTGSAMECGFGVDFAKIGSTSGRPSYLDQVDGMFAEVARMAREDKSLVTAPCALRFTASSANYLSMAHQRPTCFVELIFVEGTPNVYSSSLKLEREALKLGGRTHWGLTQLLTAEDLRKSYPQESLQKWLHVRKALIGDATTFDNAFTERAFGVLLDS